MNHIMSPVGEEGDNSSPVRGRQPVLYSLSTTLTLSARLRVRRELRESAFEYAENSERARPVPICFGVIRELKQHSLGGFGVLECTRRGYLN